MLKKGTLVRVLFPNYVAGSRGYLVGQEESGRWLVRLETNPLGEKDESFILSLEESEFEEISSQT